MDKRKNESLINTLAALVEFGVIPDALPALEAQIATVRHELRDTVVAEIDAFSASGNPQILPQLQAHAGEHVAEIMRLFGGDSIGDFGFVRDHARIRAEQKFPLEATLHAYRCGHRIISRWLRDAALGAAKPSAEIRRVVATVADFAIEYTDQISTLATSEYVARTRALAEAEGDRRTEILNVLLHGYDESDGRVAGLLRRAGYLEQRQSYCVVVIQPVDATEMENAARAQRLADATGEALAALRLRLLIGVRDNCVTAIVSSTRRMSGWTPQQSALATRIRPSLLTLGNSVLAGISNEAPSTSHVPNARDEAAIALDFASVSERVIQYSEIPLRKMMLHLSADQMQAAMPAWVEDFVAADRKARGSLKITLEAYADANMNVLRAAELLSVHPNTIYSRVQRITDKTGKNALRYHDLNELLLAADCRPPSLLRQ